MTQYQVNKNKTFLHDNRLTWKARGIMAYLVDHPHGWTVNLQDILAQSDRDGRSAVQTAMQELLKYKYARLELIRDAQGRVQGKRYSVYQTAFEDTADREKTRLSVAPTDRKTDHQENRRRENPSVGKENYAVADDHRQAGFPTVGFSDVGFSDDQKTCSSIKKDLKPKTNPRKKDLKKKDLNLCVDSPQLSKGALTRQAQDVLAYFNHVHGRNLKRADQIKTLLGTGVSADDCHLVIDWLYHVERVTNPDGYQKYVDNVTPFRPMNFDRNLDKARTWTDTGRPGPGNGQQKYRSTRDMTQDELAAYLSAPNEEETV